VHASVFCGSSAGPLSLCRVDTPQAYRRLTQTRGLWLTHRARRWLHKDMNMSTKRLIPLYFRHALFILHSHFSHNGRQKIQTFVFLGGHHGRSEIDWMKQGTKTACVR
jgi:hypothetical protein